MEYWLIGFFGLVSLAAGRASCLVVPVRSKRLNLLWTRRVPRESNDSLGRIYADLIQYLEKDKPYLNPDFRVSDAARELYTNRNYLALAIRRCGGKNFCALIGRYRVKYAVDLFQSNPTLRVSELSSMSGFASSAAFCMAFKLYMNIPPSDWCRRYKQQIGTRRKKNGRQA